MIRRNVRLPNKLGLHMRAANIFVDSASRFGAEIQVGRGDLVVNGKSIMGLMMLAAPYGAEIVIDLKYKNKKENVIEGLKRVSKPGLRVYADVESIPQVLGGLGLAILSTSKGILTGKECKQKHVGGEVLLHIW